MGTTTVDLVVTDVVMPEMNGDELRRRLRELKPALAVLFMSGYTSNVITTRGVLEDDVHFLQKPFTKDTLAQAIRKLLPNA